MAFLIEAEDIHKTYHIGAKAVPVLKGASISVSDGEAVAVLGVSGAGKSTLLYILGALHRPDQGRVLIGGDDLYGISERRRALIRATKLGFVFQSYHLLPEMDVLENVMLPMMAKGGRAVSRSRMREHAMDLLRSVGLADRAIHTPMELSGGEQQRVAVARALINDPPVVFADEPTGNLDDATGGHVLDCLFALTRSRGHALVLVTHNEKLAASCNRVLRLKDGGLAAGN
jgi:predicted ABC-type transport system involved in lysophospholipase L1 biosynthesis ATPase subunit